MKFNKELKKPLYWVHLAIILGILTGGLHLMNIHLHTSITLLLSVYFLLAIADIAAHNILGLE